MTLINQKSVIFEHSHQIDAFILSLYMEQELFVSKIKLHSVLRNLSSFDTTEIDFQTLFLVFLLIFKH